MAFSAFMAGEKTRKLATNVIQSPLACATSYIRNMGKGKGISTSLGTIMAFSASMAEEKTRKLSICLIRGPLACSTSYIRNLGRGKGIPIYVLRYNNGFSVSVAV